MNLFIQNMTCGGCAKRVTSAIKQIDEQADVTVQVAEKLVSIKTNQPSSAILSTLDEAGYPAKLV